MTLFNFQIWTIIWTVLPMLLITIPFLFKISRVIWMNFFMHYEGSV